MFRTDTDLLGELAVVLPIEEIEKNFDLASGEVNIMKLALFLIKKNLATTVLKILLEDDRKPTILDIPKAIAFYKKEIDLFSKLLGTQDEN